MNRTRRLAGLPEVECIGVVTGAQLYRILRRGATKREIMHQFQVSERTAQRWLRDLNLAGMIRFSTTADGVRQYYTIGA